MPYVGKSMDRKRNARRRQLSGAHTAVLGPAWMYGGASLAEGIHRKTAAMERLALEPPRRAKATITIERMDGTEETTVFGHVSKADECQVEVCGARCDHDSECLELPGHRGPHDTQHGCQFGGNE